MNNSLLDLSKLASHSSVFAQAAKANGFAAPGDVDRFMFRGYGKAVKDIQPSDRPKGAMFFLAAPSKVNGLARASELKAILLQIHAERAENLYEVQMDLATNPAVVHTTTAQERRLMAMDGWPTGYAQLISRQTGKCVVWGNGVSAAVFLSGDTYLESPDVVEELPSGLPSSFQSLSWDDGAIIDHFAENELNNTTENGIWQIPDEFLLRPKPERLISVGLGRFLKMRMAGYRHHEDEPYTENQGRADISLIRYDGLIYIIEVKWTGRSLIASKLLVKEEQIRAGLKGSKSKWCTEFDDSTVRAGLKQLAKYYKTGKYSRAYLAVFDCNRPKTGRAHEPLLISASDVAPFNIRSFRARRACVDPRKASKSSKSKQ